MSEVALQSFVQKIRTASSRTSGVSESDAELLARFAAARDEAAFAALVARYGCLVRNVCRHVLRDERDVEEVTQATFLLLAHRAGSLRDPAALAGWLHGVARQTALRAGRAAARRRAAEGCVRSGVTVPVDPSVEASWRELQAILDEELQRLPEKLRAPFVLCCLEAYSHKDAARRLGWKAGTVSSRLDAARKLLRSRLARRGVSLSAVLCGLAVTGNARAGLSAVFVSEMAAKAVRFVVGRAAVADPAVALATATLRGTLLGRARAAAFLCFVVGALSTGVGAVILASRAPEVVALAPPAPPPADRAAPPRVDRYGDTLPDGAIARLGTKRFAHSFLIDSVVWSPDGKVLASTGGASTARRLCLWDAATGRELHDLPAQGDVLTAAFSPDGKTLAATESRGVVLWDVATGKEVKRFAAPPLARALALSPDGRLLAAPGKDNVIQFWDVASGLAVRQFKGPDTELIGLAFSPDGQTIAAATMDGTAGVWAVDGGRELWRHDIPPTVIGNVLAVAFSPDGKAVAGVTPDLTVRIWDAGTGAQQRSFGGGAKDRRPAVTYSPDGKVVAVPGTGGEVVLWDPATGREIRRWKAGAYRVYSLRFSPDGRTLASTSVWGSAIRFWDPATGQERRPHAGHGGLVDHLAFAPDGKTLWSRARDKVLMRWNLADGDGERLFGGSAAAGLERTAVAPDGQRVATGASVTGEVRLWDNAGRELATLGRHEGGVAAVAFSADGKLLASSGKDGVLRLWDAATRKEVRHFEVPRDSGGSLAFSPDGKRLALGGLDAGPPGKGTPRVLDLSTGKELFQLGGARPSVFVVYSPDGRFLATGSDFKAVGVQVWDATTGKGVGECAAPGRGVLSLAFSPDGRYLAGGGDELDSTVRLWEVATGQEVARFRGHHSGVGALAFTPNGRTLATGGGDATILLWDLTGKVTSGQERPDVLSPSRLEECWADLRAPDAPIAYRATRALAADAGRSVPFLVERLRPAAPADAARLARLVAALDAETFPEREQAEAGLVELGLAAEPVLQKVYDGSGPAEGKRRARALLDRLAAEHLRLRRAVAALEYSGTPAARQALQSLADTATDASLAAEARSALARLKELATARR